MKVMIPSAFLIIQDVTKSEGGVYSPTGAFRETTTFYKQLADMLKSYSGVMGWGLHCHTLLP